MKRFIDFLRKIFKNDKNDKNDNDNKKDIINDSSNIKYIYVFDAVGTPKRVPQKKYKKYRTISSKIYFGAQFDAVGVLKTSQAFCKNCGGEWWETATVGGCPYCYQDWDIVTTIPRP